MDIKEVGKLAHLEKQGFKVGAEQLWTLQDLCAYFQRSRAAIYGDIKAGRLDPGFYVTPRCRRWHPAKVTRT